MIIKFLFMWDHFLSSSTLWDEALKCRNGLRKHAPYQTVKTWAGQLGRSYTKIQLTVHEASILLFLLPHITYDRKWCMHCACTLYTSTYLILTTDRCASHELDVVDMSTRALRAAHPASLRTWTPQIYCTETSLCFSLHH